MHNASFVPKACSIVKTIFFVRHGQSLANVGGVTMANPLIPLTDTGKKQAAYLPTRLPVTPLAIIASPFLRAQETATPYARQHAQPIQTLSLLHEFETIDPQLLEGMTGKERAPIVDAYWGAAEPDQRMGSAAETFREFAGRVTAFRTMELPFLADRTVIFGHGMWTAMLIWQLMGYSTDDSYSMKAFRRFQLGLPMPNAAIYRLTEASPSLWHIEADEVAMRQAVAIANSNQAEFE